MTQIIFSIAQFISASIFAATTWLFIDALLWRIEIKALIRMLAFLTLTVSSVLNLISPFFNLNLFQFIFWLQSLGLWLIFASFIIDSHSKLQFLVIVAVVFLIFLRGHELLAIQALLIAVTILQIAYHTKHKDLIPLVTVFVLMAIGEFFYSETFKNLGGMTVSGDFLYVFASIALFYWLWQYLVIRLDLTRKFPRF